MMIMHHRHQSPSIAIIIVCDFNDDKVLDTPAINRHHYLMSVAVVARSAWYALSVVAA